MNGNSLHCDLSSCAGVSEGQRDMKAQTHHQSKHLSSRELLGDSKVTLHTKLLLSMVKAESGTLLDSSQVSGDHQTEISVSYKYLMSVAGGGGGHREGRT